MKHTYTLHDEMKDYVAARRLKPQERKSLSEWVAEGNSVRSNPFYVYGVDGKLIDYISAYRFCVKEHKAELHRELREYQHKITNLSEKERDDLRKWVLEGNSVYDNPYHMTGDNGNPIN